MNGPEDGAPQRGLLVLGMHRSGTSAVTRLVNLLGVDLGENLMAPAADNNEAGFWEHQDAVRLDERAMAVLDRRWDDPRAMPADAWQRPALDATRRDLVAFIAAEFADAPLWGVKDPRLCRLLPLWADAAAEAGASPLALVVLRHPAEVARSLQRRDGLAASRAYLLWLRHLLEAERGSRTMRRAVVTYDAVLGDWRATADRIADGLGVAWPVSVDSVTREVEGFIDPGLRHHAATRAALESDPAVSPWVVDAWDAALALAAGEDGTDARFDTVAAALEAADPLFAASLDETMAAAAALGARETEALRRAQELDELRATKDGEIAAFDARLKQTVADMQARERELVAEAQRLGRELGGLASRLATEEGRRHELESRVAEIDRVRHEQVAEIDRIRHEQVTEIDRIRHEQVADLQRRNDDLAGQIEAFRIERAALRETLRRMQDSTSWRLTAPLRWVRRRGAGAP